MPDVTTLERARALAAAAGVFPLLGKCDAGDLLELVESELGHAEALDGFRPAGRAWRKAVPVTPLLHVVSGNTPHAALQSLIRGLLLGADNFVKLPSDGLPEVGRFVEALPEELRRRARFSRELTDEVQRAAKGWVVYGSDETVARFRARAGERPFQGHGHKVSFGVVFAGPPARSVAAAAKAVSLYNQKGCLSPHGIYVREAGGLQARDYAAQLARAMAAYDATDPRGPVSPAEAEAILHLRASYEFRASADHRVQIWSDATAGHWTVIYEDDPWFATSCTNRVVFVKPLPDDLPTALAPVRDWLGAAGIWPCDPAHAERLAAAGVSRICPLERMQFPPWTWRQDGCQVLAPFVRWVDFENETG